MRNRAVPVSPNARSDGWLVRVAYGMLHRMDNDVTRTARQEIAESTRRKLIQIALLAYEEAGLSGLCAEGRWEVALGAMQSCNVVSLDGSASEL